MVAHALHHRAGAGVAHGESLPCHAVDECLAAGSPVEGHIADDDVLFRFERGPFGGIDDDLSAGEALAHIVVAVPFQLQGEPFGNEGTEGLPTAAGTLDSEGVVGQAAAVEPGDIGTENGPQGPVGTGDGDVHRPLLPLL